jgi:hypothetical protein
LDAENWVRKLSVEGLLENGKKRTTPVALSLASKGRLLSLR